MIEDTVAHATSYELADRIAGDRIVAFKGRRADGVKVLMHQLTPGFDHTAVLKLAVAYMLRYPAANGGLILDLVELDGLTYLVTADEPACLDLPDWLAQEGGHVGEARDTAEHPPQERNPIPGKLATPFQPASPSGVMFFGSTSTQSAAAIRGPMTIGGRPAGPPPKAPEPSRPQPPEPQASPAPVSAQAPVPPVEEKKSEPLQRAPDPLPESAPPAPETRYIIAQPKAGMSKTLLFTVMGFLVVAALFFLAVMVMPKVK